MGKNEASGFSGLASLTGLLESCSMNLWKPLALLAPLLLSISCSTTAPTSLDVRLTHLRAIKPEGTDDPMLRGEQQSILYGAIGVNEQSERRGQYYTILWHDVSGSGPVQVVFEYQQAASGSKLKKGMQNFDASQTSGKAYFAIKGDDYLKNGRVLDWRCKLLRGGREVASRHSYLWQ